MQTEADGTISRVSPEFEAIFEEHYDLVYRTAYGVTGSVEDAEDVTQTIFLRVLHRAIPIRSMKNPAGYMYRAAANLSLTLVKSRKRRAKDMDLQAAERVPERTSREEEEHQRLYRAIAELPAKSAEVLILRYQRDLTDVEIAHLLGTSRGVVAVTLYRARRRLKKALAKIGAME